MANHQEYLKWHEKKLKGESKKSDDVAENEDEYGEDFESEESSSHSYIKFKTWKEYCDRRFKVPEENTYCRVMTESINPESVDHCGKKHFSTPNTPYFNFDILFYFFCIKGEEFTRNKAIQTYEPEFSEELDFCF